MHEFLVAASIFVCLIAAYFVSQRLYGWLPESQREEDTHQVVRSLAGLFVLMTSLLLGLMLNSARNTFEQVDQKMDVPGRPFFRRRCAQKKNGRDWRGRFQILERPQTSTYFPSPLASSAAMEVK